MEFKLITPKEAEFLKEIRFNKEEIIGELKKRLGKYEGIRYGEEQIREAKGDRARLNKFKEAIEERRKEIKRKCLEPYERFEIEVKEVLWYVEKPIKAIDEQIKGYEEKGREEKREEIEEHYDNDSVSSPEIRKLLPLEKIFNEKWLNATYKIGDIRIEIFKSIEKFMKGLEVITSLKTEYEGQIKDKYIETLDLTVALAEKERLEEQKKRLEEVEVSKIQASKTQVSKTQGAKKARTLTEGAIELQRQPVSANGASVKDTREERIYEVCFRVRATERQLNELKTFLIGNGIEYEKIGEDLPKAARA
jgi:hypothetical protein